MDSHGCDLGELLGVTDPAPPVTDPFGSVMDLGVAWSDEYSQDPYIIALAAKNTPCFGWYCPTEVACSTCPISKYCRAALRTWIAIRGAQLQEQDNAAQMKATLVSAPKKASSSEEDIDSIIAELENGYVAKKAAAPLPPPIQWTSQQEIAVQAPVDSQCWFCKNPIPEAEIALFSPGVGLMHRACAAPAVPATPPT